MLHVNAVGDESTAVVGILLLHGRKYRCTCDFICNCTYRCCREHTYLPLSPWPHHLLLLCGSMIALQSPLTCNYPTIGPAALEAWYLVEVTPSQPLCMLLISFCLSLKRKTRVPYLKESRWLRSRPLPSSTSTVGPISAVSTVTTPFPSTATPYHKICASRPAFKMSASP